MDRRAALQMSVQSIVVFVLAFIVMGLIIGVIQTMFGQITEQVDLIPSPGVELGGNPTAERPLLVQNGEVNMPLRGEASVFFGIYYNLDEDEDMGETWRLEAGECQGFDGIRSLQIQRTDFIVDRQISFGDIVKFQTNMRLEDTSGLSRGDSLTCSIEVIRDPGSTQETLAHGSFLLNIN